MFLLKGLLSTLATATSNLKAMWAATALVPDNNKYDNTLGVILAFPALRQ